MTNHEPHDNEDNQVIAARAVEDAAYELCRATLHRPGMSPAEVDVVLAHLAEPVAGLRRESGSSATFSRTPRTTSISRSTS